ncbi:MAG TPA: lysophospholipid acyltransferase family protein [Mycobacteriales bacterium]|nr:lysophospholipid acyltransferase family protein [Mycobacteriales bacterium]
MRVSGSEHLPSAGPMIVAGNHRGVVDGPVVAMFVPRPMSFVAKAELFVGPAARLLTWLGQIPVHRGRPDRAALRRALEVLESDGVLGLFPEGTRGAGALDQVQHGIAYLALHAPGCPIVPVACLGTEVALPNGSFRPRLRTRVDVVFGAPLHVRIPDNPRSRRAVAAAAEEIRAALAEHVRAAEAIRPTSQVARAGRGAP